MTVTEAFQHVQSLPEGHHAYPVVDNKGRLIGLSTSNDMKRALAAGKGDQILREEASRDLVHVHPDHTLATAIIKLGRHGISQLPVVSRKDSTRLLGIITMHDVANALGKEDASSVFREDVLGISEK